MSAITCTKCGSDIPPLEVFPGTICLDCHAAKWDAQTDEEKLAEFDAMVATFRLER